MYKDVSMYKYVLHLASIAICFNNYIVNGLPCIAAYKYELWVHGYIELKRQKVKMHRNIMWKVLQCHAAGLALFMHSVLSRYSLCPALWVGILLGMEMLSVKSKAAS